MAAWFNGKQRKKDIEASFSTKPSAPLKRTPAKKTESSNPKEKTLFSIATIQDVLGNIVRGFGQFSFDIGTVDNREFRHQCEQWTRHLLLGEEIPKKHEADDEEEKRTSYAVEERNWQGAQRFLLERRRLEKQYVESSLDDLKTVVIDSLAGLREIVATDKFSDEKIVHELNKLLEISKDATAEQIRQHAEKSIGLVLSTIRDRETKHEEQLSVMHASMSTVREELYEAKRQLKEDPLTEVFNRGAFDETFEKFIRLATFMNESFCLIMIDLDHFKEINDQFGHLAGDRVLQAVAKEIYRNFPRKDDFVARYGGDEFVVLLPGTKESIALRLCERLLTRLRQMEWKIDPDMPPVTCSIGIVTYDCQNQETAKELFARADKALYRAKENGRDQVSNECTE